MLRQHSGPTQHRIKEFLDPPRPGRCRKSIFFFAELGEWSPFQNISRIWGSALPLWRLDFRNTSREGSADGGADGDDWMDAIETTATAISVNPASRMVMRLATNDDALRGGRMGGHQFSLSLSLSLSVSVSVSVSLSLSVSVSLSQ